MTSQLEDFYDFYDDETTELSGDKKKLFFEIREKHSEILRSYLHSLLIVSLVIAILLLIKILSRCIKRKKATCKFTNWESFVELN